jgi:uncharacterized protein (DUF952 family)
MRFLYHLRLVSNDHVWPYFPASFAIEKFIHASYRDAVRESAALYFPAGANIEVLMIDPRKLRAKIHVASTPRGPMPHVLGSIERAAVDRIVPLSAFDLETFPDVVAD